MNIFRQTNWCSRFVHATGENPWSLLKFLLHEDPGEFFRFGFGDSTIEVVRPCGVDLPSRDRDIDGSYEVLHEGIKKIAHIEFHRRHQCLQDLAIDVAEAQIRLFRRERQPVVSHVWDLYGLLWFVAEAEGSRAACSVLHPNIGYHLGSRLHRDTLKGWRNEALLLTDAKSARKGLQKIMKTPVLRVAGGWSRAA